nr:filamentous hemagglutinin N-terminal domain-containing protein [uncultured Erwinia sp.]
MSRINSSYGYRKTTSINKIFRIAPLCIMTGLALGYIATANAEIILSPNQNGNPTVNKNPNDSITININAASPSGISHNKFTQFDVNNSGVILNNNATESTTALAGKVAGNSNMAKGPASLIINEVISNNASQLNGLIEVAGKKSDVIIANPSGIACDGCGFINTSKSTLTTGKIKIQNDKLVSINVKKGDITISGKGMDDKADFTSLLANTVKVSADLRAKDLHINVGKSGSRAGSESGTVGLDIATLGGMYANKITLVIDQSGPGISNKGLITADSDLSISTMGNIDNSGKISTTKGDASIFAENIDNASGSVSAAGDLYMIAADELSNSQGTITSAKSITLNGSTLNNTSGLIQGDSVSLVANQITNKDSKKYGDVDGEDVVQTLKADKPAGGILAKGNIGINAWSLLNNDAGIIHSENDSVSLASQQDMNLDNSDISAKDINIYAEGLSGKVSGISSGKLLAKNDMVIEASTPGLFDTDTSVEAGNNLTFGSNGSLDSIQFTNEGSLKAGKKFSYDRKGSFINSGNIQSGNELVVKADNIENRNIINSAKQAVFKASATLTNTSGKISADEKLMISAPEVLNIKGELASAKPIEIQSDKFENTGEASEVTLTPFQTPYQ